MREKLEKLAQGLAAARGEERKARLLGRKKDETQMRRLRVWFEQELTRQIDAEPDEKRRRVLELKLLDGLRPGQIREVLGMSSTTYYRKLKGR